MSCLSQTPPLGGLSPPQGVFQGHAAHLAEWSAKLRPKGSWGTCIPQGVTTFFHTAFTAHSDAGADAVGGRLQANVRARRGADVSGRLDLPLLTRPAAGSLWPCDAPKRAYHHRHDTPQSSGLVAACVTGYPTHCPWCLRATNLLARWTPQGAWPNARMWMWPSRKRHLKGWLPCVIPAPGGQGV